MLKPSQTRPIISLKNDLYNKIEAITRDVSKPYYRNILKTLALISPENANIISDYITAEITEINIKPFA